MENEKYRQILEKSADKIQEALEVMFRAADADTERLNHYFSLHGDLFYRAPNSDIATDVVMLPLMAEKATKFRSLVDSLEAIQEKLHGKSPGEGLSKPDPVEESESNDNELEALGFKMPKS